MPIEKAIPFSSTDVICIWGARNSGKTFLAKTVIAPAVKSQRVAIVDPMATEGYPTARAAIEAMRSGVRLVTLKSGDPAEAVPFIYEAWASSSKSDPAYIVCDEAPAYLQTMRQGLRKIMFQGRHRGVGMCIIGQRPTSVHVDIRSQAASTIFMKLVDATDIRTAAQMIGNDKAATLPNFAQGEYILHPE